ncbi:hypothetical protein [Bacillus daqingensis]|uniref:hypothetical protein n=1 Tax=Bacillus daqingensis TaxID=872396 RepID=UPI003F87BACE
MIFRLIIELATEKAIPKQGQLDRHFITTLKFVVPLFVKGSEIHLGGQCLTGQKKNKLTLLIDTHVFR